jgi:hypothetical protein
LHRRPPADDAAALAALAEQLGYPTTPAQVAQRLAELDASAEHAVWVAEGAGGRVAGWVRAPAAA